jgi:hypothetical protein
MKYINILSDLDCIELKEVPDELYDRILSFVNPNNDRFPKIQLLYDELCKRTTSPTAKTLWNELNDCSNLDSELIQVY